MSQNKQKVVFVCLGNICRSPQAEYIVRLAAEKQGVTAFEYASAGTGSWHVGSGADRRSQAKANEHDIDMCDHRAQQITARNWQQWDWFVAMDRNNAMDLLDMGVPEARILMMRQGETGFEHDPDVPDPYYGAGDGFETVFQILQNNADSILSILLEKQQAQTA